LSDFDRKTELFFTLPPSAPPRRLENRVPPQIAERASIAALREPGNSDTFVSSPPYRSNQVLSIAEFGKSPAHYVEQLRIEAARQRLEDSWENLEEIAGACGFSSAELMRRAFLRSIGVTPSEYRERFRSAGNTPLRSPVQFSSLTVEAGTAV
jgi:Helix-turn-helix domain